MHITELFTDFCTFKRRILNFDIALPFIETKLSQCSASNDFTFVY